MRAKIIENSQSVGDLYKFPTGLVVRIIEINRCGTGVGIVEYIQYPSATWYKVGYESDSWNIKNARKL